MGGEDDPNPRGWHRQNISGWWSAEEVACGRGIPVNSNHGKDKKGLHPFAAGAFLALVQAKSGYSVGQELGHLRMEHDGS